jgi:DNA-binding transcriptional regulator YdaS (Cro superfamily)
MELLEYIKSGKMLSKDIAATAGVSKGYISLVSRKVRTPSPPVALRISRATRGEVSVMELLYPYGVD